MKTSESIKNISQALSKAQKKIGSAVKGSANPFFKSRYADLGAVMEACKEHLNSEGITVLQPVHSDETGDYVETVLLHETGEFLSSRMRLLASKNMQELGSNTSYARRYGLQSMVFIPAEDDDGEAAMGRNKSTHKPSAPPMASVTTNLPVSATLTNDAPAPKRSSFKKPATAVAPAPAPVAEVKGEDSGWE